MNSEKKLHVIRPDDRLRASSVTAFRHLLKEIWMFRNHISTVFQQDFRAAYYGSGLGVVWNYILPIVPVTVYIMLGALQVFPNFDGVDGTTYRAFGITLWFLLAGCIQTPLQIIQSRNKDAMKTAFPLSASIVSSFGKLLFETMVRSVLVATVIVFTMSWPVWNALLLPFILLPAFMLFVGIGLLFGLLNTAYNDVSRVTSILLSYGIFVSGVIFPLPNHPMANILKMLNPFAIFIDASRSIVFKGTIDNIVAFGIVTTLSFVVFVIAIRLFYMMELRVRGIV